MAYSSVASVQGIHRLVSGADDSVISGFISDVDSEIDLRLTAVGYDTPFATTPPIIGIISKYLSAYWTMMYLYGSQVQEGTFEWIEKIREKAELLLKSIEEGVLVLDSSGEVVTEAPGSIIESTTEDFEHIFTLEDAEDQALHPKDDDIRYGTPD